MPSAIEKARALAAEAVTAVSTMSAAAASNDQDALKGHTARAVALVEAIAAIPDDAPAADAEAPSEPVVSTQEPAAATAQGQAAPESQAGDVNASQAQAVAAEPAAQ